MSKSDFIPQSSKHEVNRDFFCVDSFAQQVPGHDLDPICLPKNLLFTALAFYRLHFLDSDGHLQHQNVDTPYPELFLGTFGFPVKVFLAPQQVKRIGCCFQNKLFVAFKQHFWPQTE